MALGPHRRGGGGSQVTRAGPVVPVGPGAGSGILSAAFRLSVVWPESLSSRVEHVPGAPLGSRPERLLLAGGVPSGTAGGHGLSWTRGTARGWPAAGRLGA